MSWSHGDGDVVASPGRPVIDGDRAAQWPWRRRSHGRVVCMLRKQTLTHESVKLTHGSAGLRWECGQSARVGGECDWVVNKCTYCVYTVRCTRNGHGIHGHSRPYMLIVSYILWVFAVVSAGPQ